MSRRAEPPEEWALTTAPTGKKLPSTQSPFEEMWLAKSSHGMVSDAIVGTALESLRYNRLRSFLTMLGVIIGVSAVITVVTLAQGVNQLISQRFASLGTNIITISPGSTSSFGALSAAGSEQSLTLGDSDALAALPHVVDESPLLDTAAQIIYGSQNANTSVRGVYPSYQVIQDWQIAEGSWFSDQAEQSSAPDAVLGATVVQSLFPAGSPDPIGQTIRINSQLFRIVGTLQSKGTQGIGNSDDVIFVPYSAANARLKPSPQYVDQIQLLVDDINNIPQLQNEITTLLRARHHLAGPAPSSSQNPAVVGIGPGIGSGKQVVAGGGGGGGAGRGSGGGGGGAGGGPQNGGASGLNSGTALTGTPQPNDFSIFNGSQLVQTAQQSTAELTLLLVGIAAISLTVGGIGIMNIMLVSVTERTRDIGICMAIGARQRDIRNQFLLEALLLSVIGGLIGILIGVVGGFELTSKIGFPFVFNPQALGLAFGVSAFVGVVFGLYPAVRASKLDPIVALRTE